MATAEEITKNGFWANTHIYQTGHFLNADVYLVADGKAKVVKATVDLRPIAKGVMKLSEAFAEKAETEEIGFSLNPSKLVRKVGKDKLLRQARESVRSAVTGSSVRRLAMGTAPMANTLPGVRKGTALLTRGGPYQNIAKVTQATNTAADAFARGGLSRAGRSGIARGVRKGAVPALYAAADTFAPGSTSAIKAATMAPAVSKRAVGLYGAASELVSKIERGAGVAKTIRRVRAANAIPAIQRRMASEAGKLALARKALSRIPADRRAGPAAAVAQKAAQLQSQMRKLQSAKASVARDVALVRRAAPQIGRTMQEAKKAQYIARSVRQSAMRGNADAARLWHMMGKVSESRSKIRNAGAIPGVSVGGVTIGCSGNCNCCSVSGCSRKAM